MTQKYLMYSRVCLFAEDVSAPRSFPARSIKENFPYKGFLAVLFLKIIWNTAWDRDEWELAEVCPEVRRLLPDVMSFKTSSTEVTTVSVKPTTTTCCLPSSSTRNFDLPDKRSNTWKKSKQEYSNGFFSWNWKFQMSTV